MSFTRFHDDPCRIIKHNQESTGPGRWMLDTPGNGDNPCFMLDPHIIPQKWGGNLWTNSIDIQSSLLGIDKNVNRDCINNNKYVKQQLKSQPIQYPFCRSLTTEQSRAIMPAWNVRDLEQIDHYYLPEDPQKHAIVNFNNNVSTRILEKDNFKRTFVCQTSNNNDNSIPVNRQLGNYVGGPTICTNGNSCEKIN